MSKMNNADQATKIRDIEFKKWETLVKATKAITNSWARDKSNKEKKLKQFLDKSKENLEISNEKYELMSEELREHEVNKSKIKSELVKVKNKVENKTLVKYKAMKSQVSHTIREIKIGSETYKTDSDIRKQLAGHFTSIFRCDCDFTQNENICYRCINDDVKYTRNIKPEKTSKKPLDEADKKMLDREIVEGEIDNYVKTHFKKEGKSPGPDGIPYKLYTSLKCGRTSKK